MVVRGRLLPRRVFRLAQSSCRRVERGSIVEHRVPGTARAACIQTQQRQTVSGTVRNGACATLGARRRYTA